jgi:hypothetical protein
MKVVFLAPLAIVRILVSIIGLLLAFLVIQVGIAHIRSCQDGPPPPKQISAYTAIKQALQSRGVVLCVQITLVGQHPTKPLPKRQEAVSRGTLKVLGRVLLWLCSGGAVTIEVGQLRGLWVR